MLQFDCLCIKWRSYPTWVFLFMPIQIITCRIIAKVSVIFNHYATTTVTLRYILFTWYDVINLLQTTDNRPFNCSSLRIEKFLQEVVEVMRFPDTPIEIPDNIVLWGNAESYGLLQNVCNCCGKTQNTASSQRLKGFQYSPSLPSPAPCLFRFPNFHDIRSMTDKGWG